MGYASTYEEIEAKRQQLAILFQTTRDKLSRHKPPVNLIDTWEGLESIARRCDALLGELDQRIAAYESLLQTAGKGENAVIEGFFDQISKLKSGLALSKDTADELQRNHAQELRDMKEHYKRRIKNLESELSRLKIENQKLRVRRKKGKDGATRI